MSTTTDSITDDGAAVQDSDAGGTVVETKEGAAAAAVGAISTTNVSSVFWAMDNSWRSQGTVWKTFTFSAPVVVNSASQVSVSVCERDGNGNPFMGDAEMSVLNVVPRNQAIDVRWRVNWNSQLPVRLNFIIVN
jgi:hypothetical protein